MKGAVIYSSKTGNTKKVAEAILSGLDENFQLYPVEEQPDPAQFDLIFMGYWVDKGTADKKARDFMQTIAQQQVALFATLGAYADSEHAQNSLDKGGECLGEGCQVVDRFICQGAIDPKLTAWMSKLPEDHPHAPDEARVKRWEDAAKHPDEDDLAQAAKFAKNVLKAFPHA